MITVITVLHVFLNKVKVRVYFQTRRVTPCGITGREISYMSITSERETTRVIVAVVSNREMPVNKN